MKIHKLALATALLAIPATAYALSMFPVRVTVNGTSTNYRAMVIDGTTYVALRDVATMTGRGVSYNSGSRTVNITEGGGSGGAMPTGGAMNGGAMNNGGAQVGQGGTSQRAGVEGRVGQLLVAPTAAIRVDKVETRADDEDAVYLVGVIRNPSNKEQSYKVDDGALVDKEGNTTKMSLTASEMNGDVYATLQPGEQVRFAIRFREVGKEYSRAVVTIWDGGKDVVFRATF